MLLKAPLEIIHPAKLQSINKGMKRKAAIRPKGGSASSGIDGNSLW